MKAILQISTIDENTHQQPFIFYAGLCLVYLGEHWGLLRPAKRYNVSSVSCVYTHTSTQ